MKLSYERRDNEFIISDEQQSFSISGEDVAELVKVVDQIKFNFFLGGRNEKETTGVDRGTSKSREDLPRTKTSKRKKKRRALHKRSGKLQDRGDEKTNDKVDDGK